LEAIYYILIDRLLIIKSSLRFFLKFIFYIYINQNLIKLKKLIMSGIPPNQCYVCYQAYNNERVPLILPTCGHTYCKECLLLIINREAKEIICPECKQITNLPENEISNLPKNRSLLNLIIFNEHLSYNEKIKRENEKNREKQKPKDENYENKVQLNKLFGKYDEVLNNLEDTYRSILGEHSFLNEISEVLILKEVDDVLDNFIEVINEHRTNLHKKVKAEFEKVNLIKNFCNSITSLRKRLNNYIDHYSYDNCETNLNNQEKLDLDAKKNVKNSIKFHSHKNLLESFPQGNLEMNINIKDLEVNINDINFINISKKDLDCGTSEKIQVKTDILENEIIKLNINHENNFMEKQLKTQEELNNNDSINNNQFEECKENNYLHRSSKEIIKRNLSLNDSNVFDLNSIKKFISDEDLENLENEIKYSELYHITLRHFTKEIYNPCKFFFVNKFQIEKLCNDLKKMLFRACDFDDNIVKYKIHDLNFFDEKKFIKEIQDCCNQSNNEKLKFLFSHFKINPNFIYSEVLNQIKNQQGPSEFPSVNPIGVQISNDLHNNLNFNYSSNLSASANVFSSLNIFDPISVRRNINNPSRNFNSRYNSNIVNSYNAKDKVFNIFSYLKGFKDKAELNDFIKFLIEEFDYLPLKIDNEGNFDFKLVREFDWKIELGVL